MSTLCLKASLFLCAMMYQVGFNIYN
uniref:Uncharacterized protein n=1 Tax=Heterorhabditis bacteriophora TaxID=37862 RepID=A0A1I7WV59_HETBA